MTELDDIQGLQISDFRSIRGNLTVPLDAPIVLIHGPNGAGKTSILSALELTLTRNIPSMKRDDQSFEKFLVHQGRKEALAKLITRDGVESKRGAIRVDLNGAVTGESFLNLGDGQFFSDRCMLAQSVLGRLLKIYQEADPSKASALTHFVKDLLKLDQLDAVIDGLYPAGDVRNVRKIAPVYKEAEDLRKTKKQDISRLLNEQSDVAELLSNELAMLQVDLDGVLPDRIVGADFLERLREELERIDVGTRLIDERGRLNELASLEKTWSNIANSSLSGLRSELEEKANIASSEADIWRRTTGVELDSITSSLSALFPDLPSWSSTSPDVAYAAMRKRVDGDLIRLRETLSRDKEQLLEQAKLSEEIAQDEARVKLVGSQIADIAVNSSNLSAALAALLPHVRGDDCPVCGRDFGEVSREPLSAHLQRHVAQLTADAGKLGQLSAEQNAATSRIASNTRKLDQLRVAALSDEAKLGINRRIVTLAESQVVLERLKERVGDGATLFSLEASASRELGRFRDADRLSNELRTAASLLSQAIGRSPIEPTDQLTVFLEGLRQEISQTVERLEQTERSRQSAVARCVVALKLRSQRDVIDKNLLLIGTDVQKLDAAIKQADDERARAKELASIARDSRTQTVRRVFNNSLNTLWRDLFVRLAPTEPFIPAFYIPENAAEVTATLETIHRKGFSGGTPGSMLSSGNLNTAALTLFLALHFSVATSRLPWLVLDDPVQSMDELHIAQFAALLRTISRNQHRKVIIAVHEKPLFDYLALELSPAFEADRLLAIEIRRGVDDDTQVIPTYYTYEKDAVAA